MFVDIIYFRTNREMPKMNPSLRYENIQVFSWTWYESLIDFRIGKDLFCKGLKRKVFNLSKSPLILSALT